MHSVDGDCASTGLPSLADALAAWRAQAPAPIDLSGRPLGRDLLYSSGTTGRPKGIKKALPAALYRTQADPEFLAWQRNMGFDADTVYLSPAPLYHAAPLRYCLRTLDGGGAVVITARFDAQQALAMIERYRITHSQWVPTMLGRLLQLPEEVRHGYDLSSHRCAIHAAAPCPVAVKQALLDWWGDILLEYYAGSEGCGITLINSAEWRRRPGSVGRASYGRLRIVGDDGQELPAGQIGRVFFSDVAPFAYLNDPAKTREAIDERGWATYGDLGHVDEEGYLFLSDRRADLILSGGVNLYPQEIENALATHPAVQEVAVVGVPSPTSASSPWPWSCCARATRPAPRWHAPSSPRPAPRCRASSARSACSSWTSCRACPRASCCAACSRTGCASSRTRASTCAAPERPFPVFPHRQPPDTDPCKT